jgi:hypothetical protein
LRRPLRRAIFSGLVVLTGLLAASCGGGSDAGSASTPVTVTVPAASNVVAVTVDSGPDSSAAPTVNTLYTTVTVCVPGSTTECQTVDHVQVDTGSYGLRILGQVLTVSLPVATATDGNSLAECTTFVDGYSWGPVASADVQIGGESAKSLPVQVIGASGFAPVPAACSGAGAGTAEDTVASFGANGILGIGVFAQDCGNSCTTDASYGFYYSCTQSACSPITVPLAAQVLNPVPLFTADNNGTIIELPAVAAAGAATVSGSLYFGIDTESNNASGTQTVLTLDPLQGFFTTVYDGAKLDTSFIDSGSDGLFFNDGSIALCTSSNFSGFYCPTTALNLSATLTGQNAMSADVAFSIGDAETLGNSNPSFTAFASLGGTFTSSTTTFDWGLPFFYGRRVANAIEGNTTSAGTGPYVAF